MAARRSLLPRSLALLLITLLVLIGACSPLPEYARPRLQEQPGQGADPRKGFIYRRLERADFQAAALPPEQAGDLHRLNAFSCLPIRPAASSRFRIHQVTYQQQTFYVGTIYHLAFEAQFVPECSWWNPQTPAERQAYVLEHEQIHFALAELAARRLSRQAAEQLQTYHVMEQDPEAARDALMHMVSEHARQAMLENLEEHTVFDEQTSAFYDPEVQKHWLRDVEKRLLLFHRPAEAGPPAGPAAQ